MVCSATRLSWAEASKLTASAAIEQRSATDTANGELRRPRQFVPWVRLDGYHIVGDLIGVSDLFARIKPVIKSTLPHRNPDPRVSERSNHGRGPPSPPGS